mgnify:CR=1 FL=1
MFSLKRATIEDMLGIMDLLLLVDGDTDNIKPEEFLVAKDINNNLLGCGRLKKYPNCIEVASIAVYPPYRKIGVASNIITNLVESTKEKLWLLCEKALVPFFEKMGFVIYKGLVHQDIWNKYQNMLKVYNMPPGVMIYDRN